MRTIPKIKEMPRAHPYPRWNLFINNLSDEGRYVQTRRRRVMTLRQEYIRPNGIVFLPNEFWVFYVWNPNRGAYFARKVRPENIPTVGSRGRLIWPSEGRGCYDWEGIQ